MNTDIPIQTGPVYRCFTCGATPAVFVTCFQPCDCALDPWSLHIWYLKLPCKCPGASRVVRFGDCIAPLPVRNPDGLSPRDIPAIQAAIEAITHVVPREKRRLDPATRIVYALAAGRLTPAQAVAQVRHLLTHPDDYAAGQTVEPLTFLKPGERPWSATTQ